jgi:hypothetical protein
MKHRDPQLRHLRALVARLATKHPEEIRTGGRLLAVRKRTPLLRDLAHARSASVGAGGGRKALHERVSLNLGASELHSEIEAAVRDWLIRTGYVRGSGPWPPLDRLLVAWYSRVYLDPHLEPEHYAPRLAGWISQITDLLDPPHRFEIEAACPTCGADVVEADVDGETKRVRALLGTERDPDVRFVLCRACGATWHGLEGGRRLAAEIDDLRRAS